MSKRAANDLMVTNGPTGLEAVKKPARWAVDLALVGGVSAVVAPLSFSSMMALPASSYAVIAGAAGAASGLALGFIAPKLLLGMLRKVPVGALLAGGLALGSAWGALVGGFTAWMMTSRPVLLETSIEIAAVAGAIQLGWWWLPYLLRLAHGKSTWPVTFAAALLSPLLGWAGLIVCGNLFW